MKSMFYLDALTFTLALVVAGASQAAAEPGLLLVAHGSPSPQWNEPVLEFGRKVAEKIEKDGHFKAVRTAMLEAVEPSVPTAVAELESEGCDRIVAVPLFIAPTGHTHFDVPAVLGIYSSSKTAATLAEEGARAARPKVPITLTETLADSNVLENFAAEQVAELSKSPKDEAVVFLAHGDPGHQLLAEQLMRRITTRACGQSGIEYGDWAYIGVGQEYLSEGVGAIRAALEKKSRVLVVGVYLSTTAHKIHNRRVGASQTGEVRFDPFEGGDVVLSDAAIIARPELVDWVVRTAQAAIEPPGASESLAKVPAGVR